MRSQLEAEYAKYEFAKLSFKECLDYIDLYSRLKDTLGEEDFWIFTIALSKSVVITYSRPFTDNDQVNGFGGGTISTKWLKKLSDGQRRLHEFVTGDGRNSLVAHIDLGKLMPNIWIKEGEHNDYVFDYPIPVLCDERTTDFLELIQAAYDFCKEHQMKIKPHLTTDHIIPVEAVRT